MVQMADLLSIYTTQSEMSSFFVDKMAIINVESYGAVDGAATDSTEKFQDALNAAPSGAVIYCPGRYLILGALTSSYPVTIQGNGCSSELIFNNTDGDSLRINASNSSIKDIKISGTSGGGIAIGRAGRIQNILVENVRFKDIGQCVWIWEADFVTVSKCYFEETGYGVIQQLAKSSSNVLVTGCTAKNMKDDFVEANCASTAPSYQWVITNNIFDTSYGWPTAAVENRFVGITSVQGVVISNNIVRKTGGDAAVHLEDTLGEVIVNGNIFDDCVQSDGNSGYIYLLSNYENVIISNNTFLRSDNTLALAYALYVPSGSALSRIVFTGNRVSGTAAACNLSGLNLNFNQVASKPVIVIVGNSFEKLTNAVAFDTTNSVMFSCNSVYKCTNGIFYIKGATGSGGSDWLVENNFFQEITTYDVYADVNSNGLAAPKRWTVKGNVIAKTVTITDGGGAGTNSATDNVFMENVFAASATLVGGVAPTRETKANNIFRDNGFIRSALSNYADDATAAAAGVPVGGHYRNGNIMMIRAV